MKMQITPFLKYQRLFNFGSRTGIDLPNESTGVLYDRDSMHEVELATNTFGQTFTSTMIQEYAAFNAVVNGEYQSAPSASAGIHEKCRFCVKCHGADCYGWYRKKSKSAGLPCGR